VLYDSTPGYPSKNWPLSDQYHQSFDLAFPIPGDWGDGDDQPPAMGAVFLPPFRAGSIFWVFRRTSTIIL
jgi:hypothetical protein